MALPQGVKGVVIRVVAAPPEMSEQCNRMWSIESEFREMMLWEHDSFPSLDNPMEQVKEWYHIARSVRIPLNSIAFIAWCSASTNDLSPL